MSKKISSETIINGIKNAKFITEREVLLIKSRMNRGEDVDLEPIEYDDIFVTDEQSEKGLSYLRKHFLTTKNKKRKNCSWGDYELKAIGYNGEGEPLTDLNVHKLFTFLGYMNVGNGFFNRYEPIYEINGVAYFMYRGEPKIY